MSGEAIHTSLRGHPPQAHAGAQSLRAAFMRWQCRVRQIMMREEMGRPGPAITPAVTPDGASGSMGHIITVMIRNAAHDKTPELRHIVRRTNDPALRRDAALRLFSEFYYQKPEHFCDLLTATFPPASKGAEALLTAGGARLTFAAYSQRFDISCRVRALAATSPEWQATFWHNLLFNPALPSDTVILGFVPEWEHSSADPAPTT